MDEQRDSSEEDNKRTHKTNACVMCVYCVFAQP